MARLPPYVAQGTLDTGSDTFKLTTDAGSAFATGLKSLGQGVESAGYTLARAELANELKLQARAERDAIYRDQIEYIRHEDRVQQFALSLQDKIGDDAAGYAKQVEEFALKDANELRASGRLSHHDAARGELELEKIRSRIVDKAATFEATQKLKFHAEVSDKLTGRLVAEVGTVGAAGLEPAKAEWSDFITRAYGTNSRLGKKMLEIGHHRLERAAFEAEAIRRGPEFLSKFQGAFSEVPSATTGNPLVDSALKWAPVHGVDPKVALAIAQIESKLNPKHGKPIGRDGKAMSSAEGGWQIIDEMARYFGLSRDQKFDPDASSNAVIQYLAKSQSRLKELGHEATPGKTYMFWNMGQPLAERVLSADPSTPIEQVIRSTYLSRPALAEQVLRNNPSMYRPGMTVGEVLANYERQMDRASRVVEPYLRGGGLQTADQMRQIAAEMLGTQPQFLSSKDVAEVMSVVGKNVKELSAKERKLMTGEFYLDNPGRADVYSAEDRGAIDAAIENRFGNDFVQRLAQNDSEAHVLAQQVVQAAGFIPSKILHGYRAAIDSNSLEVATPAIVALADIQARNPQGFAASQLQADEREYVNDFRAYTEVLGLDPVTAAKRVLDEKRPEAKQARKAVSAEFLNKWRNGGTEVQGDERAWKELTAHFDRSWFSTPDAIDPVRKGALIDGFQRGTLYYMSQGRDFETAKALALAEIKNVWGVSSVAGSNAQTLMPYPPEKVLGPDAAVNGSFAWVRQQAQEALKLHLDLSGKRDDYLSPPDLGTGERVISVPEFRLVPQPGTAVDFRTGRPVGYQIHYRDKEGRIQVAPGIFYPDVVDARQAAEDEFRARRSAAMAKSDQIEQSTRNRREMEAAGQPDAPSWRRF